MLTWYFAARISLKQLCYERSKTLVALLVVVVACVLVFMQLGFRDSLFRSASTLPRNLNGDLFVIHPMTGAIWRGVSFSRRDLMRVYGYPHVEKIASLYVSQAQWQNPETKQKEMMLVLGYEPYAYLIKSPGLRELESRLTTQDTIAFDRLSKPEFGPIASLLSKGDVSVEVSDHKEHVVGTFTMGPSFAASGSMVLSDNNFLRLFPHRSREHIDVGIIKLSPNISLEVAKDEISCLLGASLKVMTLQELVAYEEAYWKKRTAIGFIFGMGVVIGLFVGMIVVCQILFTDVTNHLKEYATLRAMGYPQSYLRKIILSSALWIAFLGILPGTLCAMVLYRLAEASTFIPMRLQLNTVVYVWILIIIMCSIAGLFAARRLKSADPADLF